MGIMKPASIIKGVIPGILVIYGLIVAVILGQKLFGENTYIEIKKKYQYLGSGLCLQINFFLSWNCNCIWRRIWC